MHPRTNPNFKQPYPNLNLHLSLTNPDANLTELILTIT